jgi:transposase InsO family protein
MKFEAWAQTQHGAKIKALHMDHGGEYLSNAFSTHLSVNGTIRRLMVHNMPEQNGVSERLNRTLLEHTCAMLHASALPKSLWGEPVNHRVWLKNCTSTKALDSKTPHEALTGSKPNLSNLQEWGSKVWVHNLSGSKLNGRAKEAQWIVFDLESKASCVYWPEKCSIQFDEDAVVWLPIALTCRICHDAQYRDA